MEVRQPVQAASVAELAWLPAPDAHPRLTPVTPLLLDGKPAVAFPYASADLARLVAAAPQVALLLTDDRMTGTGWRPLAVMGRPRLVADPAGEVFLDELLDQELRKYPPARVLIDSVLLRRENWWYVPRLIVTVAVEQVTPVGARAGGAGEVLAVADTGRLSVDTVRRTVDHDDGLLLVSLADRAPPSGPATLLGHDFTVPDLELWTSWVTTGRSRAGTVTVATRPARTGLPSPPGLWRRLRRHRELARACRRALAGEARPAPR